MSFRNSLILPAISLVFAGCGISGGYAGSENLYRYRAYVSNSGDGTISIFELIVRTNFLSLLSTFPAGTSPQLERLHPNGKWIYFVDDANRNTSAGMIGAVAINSTTGALSSIGSPQAGGLTRPTGLAIHPNGASLYTASYTANTVIQMQIDPSVGTVYNPTSTTVGTGTGNPTDVAINGSGSYLYVTRYYADTINIFSVSNSGALTSVGSVYCGNPASPSTVMGPTSIAVSPTNGTVFVGNTATKTITAFTPSGGGATLTYKASIASSGILDRPATLTVDPTGSVLYSLDANAGLVLDAIGSGGALTSLASYPMGGTPAAVYPGDPLDALVFGVVGGSLNALLIYPHDADGTLGTAQLDGAGSGPSSVVAVPATVQW